MIKITIHNKQMLGERMGSKGPILWVEPSKEVERKMMAISKKFGIHFQDELHVTLFPILNATEETAEEIRRYTASTKQMQMKVTGVGYFDNDNGTVAFVRVECPGLEDFVELLSDRLHQLEMQPSLFESFEPHITILRGMDHQSRLSKEVQQEFEKQLAGEVWNVERVVLSDENTTQVFWFKA